MFFKAACGGELAMERPLGNPYELAERFLPMDKTMGMQGAYVHSIVLQLAVQCGSWDEFQRRVHEGWGNAKDPNEKAALKYIERKIPLVRAQMEPRTR
jgi:hypothetical protein